MVQCVQQYYAINIVPVSVWSGKPCSVSVWPCKPCPFCLTMQTMLSVWPCKPCSTCVCLILQTTFYLRLSDPANHVLPVSVWPCKPRSTCVCLTLQTKFYLSVWPYKPRSTCLSDPINHILPVSVWPCKPCSTHLSDPINHVLLVSDSANHVLLVSVWPCKAHSTGVWHVKHALLVSVWPYYWCLSDHWSPSLYQQRHHSICSCLQPLLIQTTWPVNELWQQTFSITNLRSCYHNQSYQYSHQLLLTSFLSQLFSLLSLYQQKHHLLLMIYP